VSSFPARRGRTGLQLGIHVGQQNTTMSDLLERVQRFDGVVDWVSVWDHLYEAPPNGGNTPHFEAVATLGALAAVTSTARLGCLMFCAPFRNPALLAKACVAIDHASGGRFEPGFGAGWHEPEFKAHGYEFPSLGTRFDMLTDGMEIITGMFGGASYRWSHTDTQSTTPSKRCTRSSRSDMVVFCWPT
jgi:alkanesulfonate monooxygenase SsuD/methylene tetrahydromethanopterin reductase-like flavin-dependent oxidoreductase (luciferase family)